MSSMPVLLSLISGWHSSCGSLLFLLMASDFVEEILCSLLILVANIALSLSYWPDTVLEDRDTEMNKTVFALMGLVVEKANKQKGQICTVMCSLREVCLCAITAESPPTLQLRDRRPSQKWPFCRTYTEWTQEEGVHGHQVIRYTRERCWC